VPGEVVDVGEGETPAVDPVPAGKAAKPKKSAAKKSKSSSASAGPAAEADPAADSGQGTAGSSSGGSSSGGSAAPRNGSRGSGGSTAPSAPSKPLRIVNVTGTSAAITNGPLAYTFSAPTHTPAVGKRWRLSVGVKRSGAPLTGTVKIDILHQGSIVGHAASGKLQGGRFAHDFDWPERSIGHPLTVKTTIIGGGVQQSFLFSVTVKKAG
jgi:hypothetical protein